MAEPYPVRVLGAHPEYTKEETCWSSPENEGEILLGKQSKNDPALAKSYSDWLLGFYPGNPGCGGGLNHLRPH